MRKLLFFLENLIIADDLYYAMPYKYNIIKVNFFTLGNYDPMGAISLASLIIIAQNLPQESPQYQSFTYYKVNQCHHSKVAQYN